MKASVQIIEAQDAKEEIAWWKKKKKEKEKKFLQTFNYFKYILYEKIWFINANISISKDPYVLYTYRLKVALIDQK